MGRYWKNTPAGPVWNSKTVVSIAIPTGGTPVHMGPSTASPDLDLDGCTAVWVQTIGGHSSRTYMSTDSTPDPAVLNGMQMWDQAGHQSYMVAYIDPFDIADIYIHTDGTTISVSVIRFYP
ncbi:MAG: hypothetical protein OSB57_01795 [Planctomycetota bacterium]|nr:hypothetical protein [Planctomycetota bacterium]